MSDTIYDEKGSDTERDLFNARPERPSRRGNDGELDENNDTGPGEGDTSNTKELDEEQLADAENNTSEKSDVDASEKIEKEQTSFTSEDLMSPRDGGINWIRRTRNRRNALKLATLLMFPTIGLMGLLIFSGPLKLIHIGNMFKKFHYASNETSQNSRIGRLVEFINTSGADGDRSRRNLGFWATQITSIHQRELRQQGIEINYDDGNGNNRSRMQSLILDNNTPQGARTAEALRAEGFNVGEPDANGRSTVNFREDGSSPRTRRRALDITVEAQGKRGIPTAISKRLLRVRAGVDFHPLRNIQRGANERWQDYRAARKAERAEKHRTGTDPTNGRSLSDDARTDANGEQVSTPGSGEAAAEGNDLISDAQSADTPSARNGVATRLRESLLGRVAGGAAAAVGVLCMVRDVGSEIPAYQHANLVLPVVRVGAEFITISAQAAAIFKGLAEGGPIMPPPSLDEMRAISEEVDDIENNSYFMNAESIERQNGVATGGVPLSEEVDITTNANEMPWLFNVIEQIPGLPTACGAINSATSFIKRIPIVGTVVGWAESAQQALINQALGVLGTNMEELSDAVVRFFAADQANLSGIAGASLGGVADLGVLLSETEHAIGMGGAVLSEPEFTAINNEYRNDMYKKQSEKSMFARIFNVFETDSLAGQLVLNTPSVTPSSLAHPLQNMAFITGSAFTKFSSFSSLFVGKAKAAPPVPYDYGVPRAGFSFEMLENENYADPVANAAFVEPQLAELNERYEGCFGTTIDPTSFNLVIGESVTYGDLENNGINQPKCREGGETLERYRMYILDMVTFKSMACYENLDEAACVEIGLEGNGPATSGATPGGAGGGGPSTVVAPGLNGTTIGCQGVPATPETRGARGDNINWNGIPDSGTIGTTRGGLPIKVYIREACVQTDVKTVVVASSIHASENYGQPVSFELLFRKDLPPNMRVIAIPEINGDGLPPNVQGRVNSAGVNLNRNFDYRWDEMTDRDEELNPRSTNYRGPSRASEPETQAVTSFLQSIGSSVSVLVVYHDNLNYVGAANNTSAAIATAYRDNLRSGGVAMPLGNGGGTNIYQRGSMDGWFNQVVSRPALLVEMPGTVSSADLSTHADAIIGLVRNGSI